MRGYAEAEGWTVAEADSGGWTSNDANTCYVTGASAAGEDEYRWLAVARSQDGWRVVTELPNAGYHDKDDVIGNERAYRDLCRS